MCKTLCTNYNAVTLSECSSLYSTSIDVESYGKNYRPCQ
ncbi:hypothetical protein EVA_03451 [gut metagenome]|uniref:Uncharacterized protein n=1 Tax=gut metagenome TaxID=749906 RepID=J9GKT8_9ZZZZ